MCNCVLQYTVFPQTLVIIGILLLLVVRHHAQTSQLTRIILDIHQLYKSATVHGCATLATLKQLLHAYGNVLVAKVETHVPIVQVVLTKWV